MARVFVLLAFCGLIVAALPIETVRQARLRRISEAHPPALEDEVTDESEGSPLTEMPALIELRADVGVNEAVAPPKPKGVAESLNATTKIDGKLKLNGVFYQTKCDCKQINLDGESAEAAARRNRSCANPPNKIRVRQEAFNRKMGITVDALHKLLGSPQDATLIKVDDVAFGCIDGRQTDMILGTPAGDFGEFLMALAEYEHLTGRKFTQLEVQKILTSWLDWGPRGSQPLFFHTDEKATAHLQANLHYNGKKGTVVGLDLQNPKAEYYEELLKDLLKSDNQGCYVIKAMLDNPSRFFLRKELLPNLITSYFKILWDKKTPAADGNFLHSKLNFVTLEGEPREKAWINFRSNHNCERDHMAPGFRPFPFSTGKPDTNPALQPVFVNHPQAVSIVRSKLAKFFTLFNPALSYDEFVRKLGHRGNSYMEIIAEIIGSQVPFYTVVYE